MNRLCSLCRPSERGQCLQCSKLDVATVLSSRLIDYIIEMLQHFMADRVWAHASRSHCRKLRINITLC